MGMFRMQAATRGRAPAGLWLWAGSGLLRAPVALGLAFAIVFLFPLGQPHAAAEPIGVAANVTGDVYGDSLNARMRAGEHLRFGQRVQTGIQSAVDLMFIDETQVLLGERSEIIIDSFVFDPPPDSTVTWDMKALSGVLRFVSGGAKMNVNIATQITNIGIRGTAFDLKAGVHETEIAVYEGAVAVTVDAGEVLVRAGEVYAVGADGRGEVRTAMSGEMRNAIQGMLGFLNKMDEFGAKADTTQTAAATQTTETQQAMSTRADLRDAIGDADPANAARLDTRYGPLVIELLPDLAPAHAERLRRLAEMGFYDGVPFYSVKPGFAVEAGPTEGDGSAGGAAVPLPAELTDAPFVRGTVGMIHPAGDVDGATSRFFIALAPLPHLDGKYTVVGKVVYGLDVLDSLTPGNPPDEPDVILQLRLMTDGEG